jgi:signal transduction histidine kinase
MATLLTNPVPEAKPASAAASSQRIEELGRAIRQYSAVTERLQQSHDQLQRTVQSLRNDLAEKNRELERRNRLAALGEMAAGMAHEIRNPLGGIQLYASLLAKDVAELPDSLKLVNKISAGVRRLERLVSQVLQFTRQMTANAQNVDAAEVLQEAIELARPSFETLSVDCQAQGPAPLFHRVDPMLLGQAALNLLLNAAEAAGEGGSVWINWSVCEETAADKQARMKLVISDSGPGIPSHVLDKIFNPFFTTKETGTGLGLAIVHRIVEAHDGAISVRNVPGKGAEFELRM